jgi:putative hemolysin
MIRGVFDLSERTVADVMVPRTTMVAVPMSATVEDVVNLIEEKGFVRIPVYQDSLDDIKGIVLAREIWRAYRSAEKKLEDLIHPVLFVPTTKDLESLLKQMLPHKFHVAIGVDEFGGTAGLVTIEDIIEEIVGEIQDEHEAPQPAFEQRGDEIHAAGTVSLFELNDNFGLNLPAHDFATIAGYAMDRLGRIAQVDDEIELPAGVMRITAMSGRRIERVMVKLRNTVVAEE